MKQENVYYDPYDTRYAQQQQIIVHSWNRRRQRILFNSHISNLSNLNTSCENMAYHKNRIHILSACIQSLRLFLPTLLSAKKQTFLWVNRPETQRHRNSRSSDVVGEISNTNNILAWESQWEINRIILKFMEENRMGKCEPSRRMIGFDRAWEYQG